jgi:tetratricopeptide (TPR) repeat protein
MADVMESALAQADAANAEGGTHYAASRFEEAEKAYSRAIDAAGVAPRDALALRLAVYYSNRSQARLRLESNKYAAHDAALALSFDPSQLKAALRHALALERLGRTAEAISSAKHLAGSASALPERLAREVAALLQRLTQAAAAEADSAPTGAATPSHRVPT